MKHRITRRSENGMLQLRVTLPEELAAIHGKSEIRRSLRTMKQREAEKRVPLVLAEIMSDLTKPIEEYLGRELTDLINWKPYWEKVVINGVQEEVFIDSHPNLLDTCEAIEHLVGEDVALRFADRAQLGVPLKDTPEAYREESREDPTTNPRTIKRYVGHQQHFIRWLGSVGRNRASIYDVTEDDAADYIECLREEGKSAQTILSYTTSLRSLWKWARLNRKIRNRSKPEEVLSDIWADRGSNLKAVAEKTRKFRRAFTSKEVEHLSKELLSNKTYYDLFVLGLNLGARLEELCGIKAGHLRDYPGEGVWIFIPGTKKESSSAEVPVVSRECINILKARAEGLGDDEYIFSDSEINPYRDDAGVKRSKNITRRMNRVIRKSLAAFNSGLTDDSSEVSFHSTRYTYTTCADESGADDKTIRRLRRDTLDATWAKVYARSGGRRELVQAQRAAGELLRGGTWYVLDKLGNRL